MRIRFTAVQNPAAPTASGDQVLAPLMASLSLLLIAFFILFYSMSMISERKKAIALGSLQGSFGYLEGGRVVTPNESRLPLPDQTVIQQRAVELKTRLEAYLRRRGIQEKGLEVTALDRGYRITLPQRFCFSPAGIRLTPAGEKLLLQTVRLFRIVPGVRFKLISYIRADSRQAARAGLAPLALAALRAERGYHFLVLEGGLPAGALQAGGREARAGRRGGSRLEIEIIGAEPAFVNRGRQRPFKIGDYTF